MTTEQLHRTIKDLREELRRIDHVIESLEGVAEGKPKRGRPPKFLSEAREVGAPETAASQPAKSRKKARKARKSAGKPKTPNPENNGQSSSRRRAA